MLVFGLVGGWFLAGRMLAPLNRITDATRVAADGSLSHRIRLPGRRNEFRELADAPGGKVPACLKPDFAVAGVVLDLVGGAVGIASLPVVRDGGLLISVPSPVYQAGSGPF